jgi:sugar/nucleoside kinase (ribokinase family)
VFSRDDVSAETDGLDLLRHACPTTVITNGARGADVSWDNDQIHIPAPVLTPVDDTGAGDIFAAVFFVEMANGRTPADAAFEATRWASFSVLHAGPDWIRSAEMDEFLAGANR